jgi:hypothetical protein
LRSGRPEQLTEQQRDRDMSKWRPLPMFLECDPICCLLAAWDSCQEGAKFCQQQTLVVSTRRPLSVFCIFELRDITMGADASRRPNLVP